MQKRNTTRDAKDL